MSFDSGVDQTENATVKGRNPMENARKWSIRGRLARAGRGCIKEGNRDREMARTVGPDARETETESMKYHSVAGSFSRNFYSHQQRNAYCGRNLSYIGCHSPR